MMLIILGEGIWVAVGVFGQNGTPVDGGTGPWPLWPVMMYSCPCNREIGDAKKHLFHSFKTCKGVHSPRIVWVSTSQTASLKGSYKSGWVEDLKCERLVTTRFASGMNQYPVFRNVVKAETWVVFGRFSPSVTIFEVK